MSQDNIFREVDEELRSDRMRTIWRRFGPAMIAAAVLVVLLVAANEGWTWYQNTHSTASSDKMFAAYDQVDAGNLEGAQTTLDEIIASGTGNYPTLASFRHAGLLARQGNPTEAIAAYDALANAQSDARLRELALLMAGSLLVDNGSAADVEARVASLTAENGILRNPAREILGLAYYKAQNYTGAEASFQAVLDDPLSGNSVRNRVGFYLAEMLSEGAITAEPDAAPATTDQPAPASSNPDEAPAVPEAAAPATPAPTAPEAAAPAPTAAPIAPDAETPAPTPTTPPAPATPTPTTPAAP